MITSFSTPLFETLIGEGDASATSLRNHSYLLDRDLLLDSIALLIFIARESYKSKNYEETIADNNSDSEEWEDAIENEINFLMKNKTWELVDYLKDRKSLKDKWVFILKRESKEEITRYKARWVILECSQREELNYNEIFVLVVKFISYKALFALAATLNWDLKQINVKIVFLYDVMTIVKGIALLPKPFGQSLPQKNGSCHALEKGERLGHADTSVSDVFPTKAAS